MDGKETRVQKMWMTANQIRAIMVLVPTLVTVQASLCADVTAVGMVIPVIQT